jgi:hypothetical protein
MEETIDAAPVAAAHLKTTQGRGSIDIPRAYHSNWPTMRSKLDPNWRRAPISPNSTLPGLFTARPTIRRRFGIRVRGTSCSTLFLDNSTAGRAYLE